jgi:hypothetical protein
MGAAAFRVYADPADLFVHIEDRGIPGESIEVGRATGPT